MEISRDHAKALIHSGPCERAKNEMGSYNPTLPGKGICEFCDLVRLLKLPEDNPKDGLPMKDEGGLGFLSIRSWWRNRRIEREMRNDRDETEPPPKGHIPISRSS